MKPSVEKGLASHSSIMVAPRVFTRGSEDGDGWIKVSSKKTLRKNKGIHKNKPTKDISFFSKENNQDEVSFASNTSIKSENSGRSWSSILKKSLRMDAPRVSIDIASTSSTSEKIKDIKNEVKYLKTVHTYEDSKDIGPSKTKSPPQIITIPDSDEASTTESEFSKDASTSREKVCHTRTVQQKSPEDDEGSTFSGQNKMNKKK